MRKNNNEKEKNNIIKQTKTQLIMKFKPFILGTMAMMAALFTACSSDEPVAGGGQDNSEATGSENYVSVSIMMPTSAGTRAAGAGDNDSDKYDDGTPDESKVNNVVFFFFDNADNCVDVQKINNPKFEDPAQPSENPYVTNYGTVEVRLKTGITYNKVAVALNTSVDQASALQNAIKTVKDLEDRHMDYIKDIPTKGQVMSNSIYFDTNDRQTAPQENQKVFLVEITADNIYTSAERGDIENLIKKGTKKYVEIYVERVVARIDVDEVDFDMTKYYTYKDGETEMKTIKLYDHANNSSEDITVQPVVQGMILNVLTPETKLIKPLDFDEVGYNIGSGAFRAFQWNDPDNRRSYWASTALRGKDEMKYYSWDDAVDRGSAKIKQYVNPNTLDWSPVFGTGNNTDIRVNEGSSRNTKVMVVAELHKFNKAGEDQGPIDLVRFGPDYMLPTSLLEHAANIINNEIRALDWKSMDLKIDEEILTEAQINSIEVAVSTAFVTGLTGANFELAMLQTTPDDQFGEADWEAKVVRKASNEYTLDLSDDLKALATPVIEDVITKALNTSTGVINKETILYWKDGKTYYYTNIRHQGFYGLTGNSTDEKATDFLYGVVRNHIYKVNMTGIYGLGTPVIDPGKPIDPDRPKNERPSYIQAKINILPWRLVTNNATIH